MSKAKILFQLDADEQASTFDGVVAVDAGVDQLFVRSNVTESQVESLTHGAMFTRGPQDLSQTAIFIGGSDVQVGEQLLERVTRCFFGPMRVSVMLDANGANTTASAAVIAASRHLDLAQAKVCVLAGTGPVGQRVAQLLGGQGSQVVVCSRKQQKAAEVCERLAKTFPDARFLPQATSTDDELATAIKGADGCIAAGAAGIRLLPKAAWAAERGLKVMIDLNAVEPAGIEAVGVMDKATDQDGRVCYGAIGVGGTKMKIHKEAIRRLFQANDMVFDAPQLFELGLELEQAT